MYDNGYSDGPMYRSCVSEERVDGEDADSQALSLLSYTLRYINLAEVGVICQVGVR